MLQLFGNVNREKLIDFSSLISAENISSISIRACRNLFSKRLEFFARIEFERNGETFEKRFDAINLMDAYMKVYNFCLKLNG